MAGVRETELAGGSVLHAHVRKGDFLDCYSVDIGPTDAPLTEVAQRILTGLPCWMNTLLTTRDLAVSALGLKTTSSLPRQDSIRPSVEVGESINFFRVHSRDQTEIVLGEDDRHLDFRISVRRDGETAGRISLATWVQIHNRLGDLYLRTILPFHRLIVRSRLAALARHYRSGEGGPRPDPDPAGCR